MAEKYAIETPEVISKSKENIAKLGKDNEGILNKFAEKFDQYGQSAGPPTPDELPKTPEGAIMSIICYAFVAALIGSNVVKLFQSAYSGQKAYSRLPTIVTYNAQPDDNGKTSTVYWDIPPLILSNNHFIYFYERDHKPAIQKITVEDETGYTPYKLGNTNKSVHSTKSIALLNRKVTFNSFLSPLTPGYEPRASPLSSTYVILFMVSDITLPIPMYIIFASHNHL